MNMGDNSKPAERWADIRQRCTILENDQILVLNKPPGISVIGERHDWDLITLAAAAGEDLIPAHRIDKVTSGAILLAKTLEVQGGLTRQFNKRTVDKCYLAITNSTGLPDNGTIDLPLSKGRKNRVRIAAPRESIQFDGTTNRWSVPDSAVFKDKSAYPSMTMFTRLREDDAHSLLLLRPVTGRRHQIRVHLAWIGHPIVGDPLFTKDAKSSGVELTHLHSWHLAFNASWADGTRIGVEAQPATTFWCPLSTPATDKLSTWGTTAI